MFRLFLVRHGWTAWHTEGRVAGWSDVPLDDRGQAEALAAGRWLAAHVGPEPPVIVASPVLRAWQSAALIADCLPEPQAVQVDDGFAETRVGRWEGMLVGDIQDNEPQWPEFFRGPARFRFPGGESLEDVQRRAVTTVQTLAAAAPGRTGIVVAHADPLRCIIAHFLGINLDNAYRLRLACGSISRLSLPLEDLDRPGNWPHVDFLNMTEHLPSFKQGDAS
ncbi:MAG: histidine phosphatase family protein [Caldilineales bacterium]